MISYLELWWPFCSVERYHLWNFEKGHYEVQFCGCKGCLFLQRSGTVSANLVEGIKRNNSMK